MTTVLDIERLRVDPIYQLVWIFRLALGTIVVAAVLALAYLLGWTGA